MKRQTRVRLLTMLLCFVLMFACTLSACKDAVPTPDPDKTDTCTDHVDKDGDGKCDKCGADVPTTPTTCTVHVDKDGDGKLNAEELSEFLEEQRKMFDREREKMGRRRS